MQGKDVVLLFYSLFSELFLGVIKGRNEKTCGSPFTHLELDTIWLPHALSNSPTRKPIRPTTQSMENYAVRSQ